MELAMLFTLYWYGSVLSNLMEWTTDRFVCLVVTTYTSLGLMVLTKYVVASLNLVSRFRSAIHCSSLAVSG